jgi:hypothetical protein
MNFEIFKIKLELRLEELEFIANQPIIAGVLDSIELAQIKGAIKELKKIIAILEDQSPGIPAKSEFVCIRTSDE